MLDHCLILRKNGVVLWRGSWAPMKGNPVDALIRTVLMEERGGVDVYQDDANTVKWTLDNDLDLLFVVIYQRGLVLQYVEELLVACKQQFPSVLRKLPQDEWDGAYPCDEFTATFARLQKEAEKRAVEERLKAKKPREFAKTEKFQNTRQGQKEQCMVDKPKEAEKAAEVEPPEAATGSDAPELSKEDQIAANIAKLKTGGKPGPMKKKGSKAGGVKADDDGEPKKGKDKRSWDESTDNSKPLKGKQQLDFSKKEEGGSRARVFKATSKLDLDATFGDLGDDDDDADADDDDAGAAGASAVAASGSGGAVASGAKKGGGMMSAFRGLVGGKSLERADLQPIVDKLQERLVAKNVAENIGQQVCESVCSGLLGKQLGSFAAVSTTVKQAMEGALTRILTPTRRVDLLADVSRAKAEKRPYVIVFVGVNGVGKSTSLSKVAYYLKTNGFVPMLCACDTFRAGAVEQLRVHANALELPLYEKGYGRDASGIATDGISHARQMGHDVVLVDTAGRMQDNEPLMRSLAKLVNVNSPDLVLFVGEALVGNEAVAQVTGFNQSLSEFSASRVPRMIDGIMLTKFDTISDKVGAALSLVYTTGKPVVFVGVGQTYTDIRHLNVDHVVKALLR